MRQFVKRLASIVLSFAVLLSFTPFLGVEAFAVEDTTAPVLDPASIHVEILGDRPVAGPGDTVRVYADVYDEETPPISRIILEYRSPITGAPIYADPAQQVEGTNTWYFDFHITESSESGLWRWDAMRAEDSATDINFVWYMNENLYENPEPREYDRYLDLSAGDFMVEGTTSDTQPPVIDLATLKASPAQAVAGDTVTVSVKITDDVAVEEARVWIKTPDGDTDAYTSQSMSYNGSTDRWEFKLPVTEELMKGKWTICLLTAKDSNGHEASEGNNDATSSLLTFLVYKPITPKVTLSKKAFTYNGKVQTPAVTVKDGSTTLKQGTDYTVSYSPTGRKSVGKYTATVTLTGGYKGSAKAVYQINPKGTSLKKLSKARKAATIRWSKQSAKMSTSRITGYQIQLATNSKFTKNKKTVNVKGYSKTSKKVKKLKGGKKYYVRIRTYKTVSGVNYYSPWSKVKTVKTYK